MPYTTTAEVIDDVQAVQTRLTETLALVDLTAFTEADAGVRGELPSGTTLVIPERR